MTIRFQTVSAGETWSVFGRFRTSRTITVALFDGQSGAAIPLSSTATAEIAATGIYVADSSQIVTDPVALTIIAWQMTDTVSGRTDEGVIAVGGSVDNIDAAISSRNAVVPMDAATSLAEHDNTQAGIGANLAAIAGLEDLSSADVQAAMTAQGYTAARAPLLDNLDAAITSRATQASVDAIQNNTRFAGIVNEITKLPVAGTTTYRWFGRLFDATGNPEDPDALTMNIRIEDAAGGIVQATVAMTRTGVGLYQFDYLVNFSDPERQLNVFFEYDEAAVSFQHVRTTLVSEFESKLDIIQTAVVTSIPNQITALNDVSIVDVQTALTNQGYTAARALLLDNLDALISSRAVPGDAMTLTGAANTAIQALILSDATPFAGADIAAILLATQNLASFIEGGREIDFVGSDVLGWQRIERNIAGIEIRRYNLFDELDARINETVSSFIGRQGMISRETII